MKTLPFILTAATTACLSIFSAQAQADNYPSRPIRLIIGFPPGGGADAVARPIAERMSRELGQPVIVDNRPGAGTTLASATVARAAPDGYTLMLGSAGLYGADQFLYRGSVSYTGASFTPINRVSVSPMLLTVSQASGITSVSALIAAAKAEPGKLNYASSGNGVIPHIAALYFQKQAGIHMEHVPYKGGAAAIQSLVTGETQLSFGTPPSVLPLARGGRVRALAVTSAARSPLFPDIPTVSESGVPGFDFTFWFGLYGPAGLPEAIVQKLFKASSRAVSDPKVAAQLAGSGNQTLGSASPAEFRDWAAGQGRLSKELTEQSGAQVD